jgi:hypothetical protein
MSDRKMAQERQSYGDRFASALASVIFTLPLSVLFWLLFNSWLNSSNASIPFWTFLLLIPAVGIVAYVAPNFGANLAGRLVQAFFWLGRWW